MPEGNQHTSWRGKGKGKAERIREVEREGEGGSVKKGQTKEQHENKCR